MMRRIVIVGAVVGVGLLIVRAVAPKLRDRLMARCEGMFEQMPDDFPPKKMMRAIDEIGYKAARILELLETRKDEAVGPKLADASSTKAMVHEA
jgi:hypothetical protein